MKIVKQRYPIQEKLKQAKHTWNNFRTYEVVSHRVNQSTPTSHFSVTNDIYYGDDERQCLDLYYAVEPRPDRAFIVFVHGGTWTRGDKADYLFVAESFAREGFDVAVLNYRLAPRHHFPDYVDDVILAVNYLTAQQQSLSICLKKIVLMGHSAGAFNIMSALYASSYRYQFDCFNDIKAVVSLAGPFNFDYADEPKLQQAFPVDQKYKQVMPYYFVKANHIEHLLIVASNDFMVAPQNSRDMHYALCRVGNISTFERIAYTGHISLIGSLSSFFSDYFATKRLILSHLDRVLADPLLGELHNHTVSDTTSKGDIG